MSMGWKWIRKTVGVLTIIIAVLGGYGIWKVRQMGFLRSAVFETERTPIPALKHPAVLVFSKTNSFIHSEAIPAAQELMQHLARERGWSILFNDSGAIFNAEDLGNFDVVVWNNVTGDVLLPAQRAAMQVWLESGGGFIGLHAAGDNSHEGWPWYQDTVIRARFIGHPIDPQFQRATLRIEQPADPIVTAIPDLWSRTDEWYSFAASPRAPGVRVLVTIDETTYTPGAFLFGEPLGMGSDHPMIWKHCVGRGRVFYAAPGHTAETYAEAEYREVLARAITWAGRMEPAQHPDRSDLTCESK